ncbi:helicase HerA-like domain-containing protein [Streptomyces sp. NPDC096153]|uniref:helicase HerA-like domain-containing protein n=1 Tax=Streptomyces sp. NPDC096153 TaxID=3155548 RepID=UPI003331384F
MGPVGDATLDAAVRSSVLYPRYAPAVDRESAYERLTAEQRAAEGAALRAARDGGRAGGGGGRPPGGARGPRAAQGRVPGRTGEGQRTVHVARPLGRHPAGAGDLPLPLRHGPQTPPVGRPEARGGGTAGRTGGRRRGFR